MGRQVHIKLSDVLARLGEEDKIEITNEVFPADMDQGWPKEVVRICRISLIGHSHDYPNISFALSMGQDLNSMWMDYNEWGDDFALKQEFIERLGVSAILS